MNIETNNLSHIASFLQSQLKSYSFPNSQIQRNHQIIQNKLFSLSNYFQNSKEELEQIEGLILKETKGKLSHSHYENWNAIGQLFQKDVNTTLSQTLQYSYSKCQASYKKLNVNISTLNLYAHGKVQCRLWKNKKFDPRLSLSANVDGSLASGTASMKIGNDKIYAKANAKGWAGVVYGKAKAVLSFDEQTLSLGAGFAALKGSISCSFHIFGASVVLTGSGSIGSMEANVEYSHKNREWEFGSKLGFICGLGFKVKVNY
ncbi:hypothetical protein [Floccifex sp.]|uniref:hypothetical protein n=1 Tax=Floccifex sp. TaxID=2815810 RepID=UPI002A765C92|nr:hypothetical protein [Floccifex sp.]MDD7280862.1 hypothetical protein [Erysipelotrichaceae bacterium]MDY2958326.1 hypothetical protein [Floccifex sp.]